LQLSPKGGSLELAFDEIRQFGATSVQVDRRLRAGLVDLAASVEGVRRDAVLKYLTHLDKSVSGSAFDDPDRATASKVDRQGLGLTRPSPTHDDCQKLHSLAKTTARRPKRAKTHYSAETRSGRRR
jgi:hypothetical protein